MNHSVDFLMMASSNVTESPTNTTTQSAALTGVITWDDATWILTSSFIILTMQSGFGLLEAGAVTSKNEVNIMVKNAADVIFGGMTYWMFGFGLSFGNDEGSNGFCGIGRFFVDADDENMGAIFSMFVFQLSFATTATTIVSGAMAERTKLTSYIIFSCLNTVIYCIPAHWLWDDRGFLRKLGVIDIAGSGGVHVIGGSSALVAAIMLKPRIGRFDHGSEPLPMGNPVNSLLGVFMLWWGWLGFNCGSTFGISGSKWKLAAKSAIVTLCGSIGGGVVGMSLSYITRKRKYEVEYIVNSILGGLVSITAGCAVIRPWEALLTGAIGAVLVIYASKLINILHVDDPVGAVAVHGFAGMWGLLAVGLFTKQDTLENLTLGRSGLTHGGGFYLLGVQMLAIVCLSAWAAISTFILLLPIHLTMGIRLSPHEEMLGSDFVEHNISSPHNSNILFSRPQTATTRSRSQRDMDTRDTFDCQESSNNHNSSRKQQTFPKSISNRTTTTVIEMEPSTPVRNSRVKMVPQICCYCCKKRKRVLAINS